MITKHKKTGFCELILLVIIGSLFFSSCMHVGVKRLNRYNDHNEKTGLWVTTDSLKWIDFQNYSSGKLHGQFKRFRDNGNIAILGRYKHGVKIKTWRYYNANGQEISWAKYRKGRVIKDKIGSISF